MAAIVCYVIQHYQRPKFLKFPLLLSYWHLTVHERPWHLGSAPLDRELRKVQEEAKQALFRPCCIVSRDVSSDPKLSATIKDFCSFCVKNELDF